MATKAKIPVWARGFEVQDRVSGAGFILYDNIRVGWITSHSKNRIVLWPTDHGLPDKKQCWAVYNFAMRYWEGKEILWAWDRETQVKLTRDLDPEPTQATQ